MYPASSPARRSSAPSMYASSGSAAAARASGAGVLCHPATGALLFIDLNEFKPVNDRYGHEVGDQLLSIAATRLKKSLRSCDIIGRPGGDEFVALVPDVTDEVADRLAYRLSEALEQPYIIDGKTLKCAASIGLATYPKNASTLTGLMREADQAMYRAKARCRGTQNVHFADLLEKAI